MADHFTLLIGEVTDRFTAPPEGGARFHVTARVAGRTFEEFHLDVGLGEPLVEDAEWVNGDPVLSFAGIAPARFALLPVPQQIAEKIHA